MASWVLKASTKSGNADGANGPFKAPAGASTSNCTGADLYVVLASGYQTPAPANTDLTDVSLNTYTLLTSQAAAGDPLNQVSIFYKVGPAVSSVEQWTLTQFGRNSYAGLICLAFSGCHQTVPAVVHNESGATSSTPGAGSVGVAGNLVITAVADYTSTVVSIDSSFVIILQSDYTAGNNIGIAAAWNNSSGGIGGAVNPLWTLSGSPGAVACQSISFAPAAGGVGGSVFATTYYQQQARQMWGG